MRCKAGPVIHWLPSPIGRGLSWQGVHPSALPDHKPHGHQEHQKKGGGGAWQQVLEADAEFAENYPPLSGSEPDLAWATGECGHWVLSNQILGIAAATPGPGSATQGASLIEQLWAGA